MGALLVCRPTEIPRRALVLRLGTMSLTDNLDPDTVLPGELPNSLVASVEALDEDNVRIRFEDGTDVVVDASDYAEAI
jgi:hypothetical protein